MIVKTGQPATTSEAEIDLIVHGNHWDPFSVLGSARAGDGGRRQEELGHPRVPARGDSRHGSST